MGAQHEDVIFLLEKRIVSLEETKASAMEFGYVGSNSLYEECEVRIRENELLITLIEKL